MMLAIFMIVHYWLLKPQKKAAEPELALLNMEETAAEQRREFESASVLQKSENDE
jgi:cbb3-type cytochrome oxidase subunit 3